MPHRRSSIFADKRFQLRAASYVCAWLVALSVIYPVIVYNLFGYFIQIIGSKTAVVTVGDLQNTRNKVLILLLVLELFFAAGVFLATIFVTHRLIGPLIKIRNAMDEAGTGDLNRRLTLRRDDDFHDIAEAYNIMIDDVRNRSERTMERLSAAVGSLERALENPGETKREIEETLASLKTGLKEIQQ